jgi:hypothetical protein
MATKRLIIIQAITTILILSCGFIAGYSCRGLSDYEPERHRAFVEGQRDITAYVEDCTLEDAHAERCTIPCSGDADCQAKNGSRDNY